MNINLKLKNVMMTIWIFDVNSLIKFISLYWIYKRESNLYSIVMRLVHHSHESFYTRSTGLDQAEGTGAVSATTPSEMP